MSLNIISTIRQFNRVAYQYSASLSNSYGIYNILEKLKYYMSPNCYQGGFCNFSSSTKLSSILLGNSYSKDDILRKVKSCQLQQSKNLTVHHVDRPSPETAKGNYRFKVHYPEDGKYTIKKLQMTKLGGRDPDTGRLIFGKIGGGNKRKYRWVIFDRLPPGSKDPLIEKVIHVQYDPNRSARIALVGHDDQLRYIIATANMKAGDLITSTRKIPEMAIRPKEGDAHPVGAVPFGTQVCCIELKPHGPCIKIAAGTSTSVSRKVDGKIILQVNKHTEYAIAPECLATVGQVSNPDNNKKQIGSAQRARWLGIRPSSGLFQKKGGRFGYKRKDKIKLVDIKEQKTPSPVIRLTLISEQSSRRIIPATNRVT